MGKIKINSWLSQKRISEVRAILRNCPYKEICEEGLACLKNAKPNYLANLITMDHPDRVDAIMWIVKNS